MVKTTLANSLFCLSSARSFAAFSRSLHDPDAAQEHILRALLRVNRDTSFGREHHFNDVHTPADFARRVPNRSYDEFSPWIDRIRRGDAEVLTREPVVRLVPTSGSTGCRKLIPYTREMQQQLNRAIGPWIFGLYRQHPRALSGSSYWSISPVAQDVFTPADASSVPIGFDDDSEYLGGLRKILVGAAVAVPPEVRQIPSVEAWRYITALLLLRNRKLSLISVWHPSFLQLLLQEIRGNWQQLLADIANSTCAVKDSVPNSVVSALNLHRDSHRANRLQQLGQAGPMHWWPNLALVSCWADGHAAGAAGELARSFQGVAIQPKGLIATEGIISIPFGGLHPLAIRSHYFEFEDESGHLRLASKLELNRTYSVILTTAGGLYRYRLDDLVTVDGKLGRTPSIRFLAKSAHISDRRGEKLSDSFVASVLAKCFSGISAGPSFAMLAPDVDQRGCRYTLYLSADVPTTMHATLDRLLSDNPHYAYCRRLGQLESPRLFQVTDNAYACYCQRLQDTGKRLGEIKPAALSGLDGWSAVLPGRYIT